MWYKRAEGDRQRGRGNRKEQHLRNRLIDTEKNYGYQTQKKT